jgi:hypothetical protein
MSHSARSPSLCRKLKRRSVVTGIQTDVEALRTTPSGTPGSSTLFRTMTRTSAPMLPVKPSSLLHSRADDALTPEQKFSIILRANFNKLCFPSSVTAVEKCGKWSFYFKNAGHATKILCYHIHVSADSCSGTATDDMRIAKPSHWRCSVASHLPAPNARLDWRRGRYSWCTDASSYSVCSTHVT